LDNKTKEKIEKLRTKFPEMFSHPEVKPGEVWIGDFVIDFVAAQLGIFASHGCKSVRVGKTETFKKITGIQFEKEIPKEVSYEVSCRPIFALAEEAVQLFEI
jgi:hypothetical protein